MLLVYMKIIFYFDNIDFRFFVIKSLVISKYCSLFFDTLKIRDKTHHRNWECLLKNNWEIINNSVIRFLINLLCFHDESIKEKYKL